MVADLSQTLDQQRARHAWDAVERLLQDASPSEQEEYATEAKKLPIRIMTSGLGQALAFIASKAKDKKKGLTALQRDLSDWVLTQRKLGRGTTQSLLEAVCKGDSVFLRRASDEVLRYLEWLNRFVEAKGVRHAD